MRKVFVIGIGAGDPDYVTVQAIKALNQVDVFLIPDKGCEKADLKQARLDLCQRLITERSYALREIAMPQRASSLGYRDGVETWHHEIADAYAAAILDLPEDARIGVLVWGDPALYDSTLRIFASLRERGLALSLDVIPGITAIQALCARHQVPLNGLGEPVLVTTGRALDNALSMTANIVVMLDGTEAFARVPDAEAIEIFWGAYLGTPDEILVHGCLREVRGSIRAQRAEARARKGWIMDTYLLRRSSAVKASPAS